MSDSVLRVVGDEAAYAIIARKRAQEVTGVYPTKDDEHGYAVAFRAYIAENVADCARLRITDDELEVLAWLSSAGDEGRDTIQRITPGMRSVIRGLLERHENGGGA